MGVANTVARADGKGVRAASGQAAARTVGCVQGGRERGAMAACSGGYRLEQVALWPVDAGMLAGASEGPIGPLE